jgi:hypothetical protein
MVVCASNEDHTDVRLVRLIITRLEKTGVATVTDCGTNRDEDMRCRILVLLIKLRTDNEHKLTLCHVRHTNLDGKWKMENIHSKDWNTYNNISISETTAHHGLVRVSPSPPAGVVPVW